MAKKAEKQAEKKEKGEIQRKGDQIQTFYQV
jgi:hypothetical protein